MMKAKLTYLILFVAVLCIMMSCDSQYKRQQKAQHLYEEGVRLRSERLSEKATKCFLEALSLVDDDIILRANIKDNLGAMYNKHQMFEDALLMHLSANDDFKKDERFRRDDDSMAQLRPRSQIAQMVSTNQRILRQRFPNREIITR